MMLMLTPENDTFNMNRAQAVMDTDIRYCVLDYSDPKNVDYVFFPLVFMETYTAPAVMVRVGPYTVSLPMDWSVVISDASMGQVEVAKFENIMHKGFQAFVLNPLTSSMAEHLPIDVEFVFSNVKWNIPKMRNGHILCVPLENTHNPRCAYFLKDTNKVPEVLDLSQMI